MVVTKDATITVASVNVTLITIGYLFNSAIRHHRDIIQSLNAFVLASLLKHATKEIHAGNGEISLFSMNNSAPSKITVI